MKSVKVRMLRGLWAAIVTAALLPAQAPQPTPITLKDALARARQFGGTVAAANVALAIAREDRVQLRAASLPSVNLNNGYVRTQPNGTDTGTFVGANGPNEFVEQAVVHQELLPLVRRAEVQRAIAIEAAAKARIDVAVRGLNTVIIQDYYAISVATRKVLNANASLKEAQDFLAITQKLEAGGEAAHADVITAQIALRQRQRDLDDAALAVEKAKIALAVLIFADFHTDFTVTDNLEQAVENIPAIVEAEKLAITSSPDINAARIGLEQAGYEIRIAKYGYLPSLGFDFLYGLNANQLKAHDPAGNRNLGYGASVSVTLPVFNWGATRSKVKQAELRKEQAQADLTLAQRTQQANLATAHREAESARAQVASLLDSQNLSIESLRLTVLRYQAGEATAFEVSGVQATVTQARNAYDDGLARYRIAMANLQTLMGQL